ncbi:DNA-binding protein [Streptomyces sudanensis]|uniref:DNA-binding protein n=1 Tax=Streptomyces sudanensis TaxID=436397 RepID=UPI0020CB70DD|nr:DNA-binding protein [Streptomyces sudanensis]MCP9987294.1 DNA-binding protein [Streptomyces sudanensis]
MNHRIETVVLDSRGLSAWVSRDRAVLAMIRSFHSMAADLVVCANTITEVVHARVNTARLDWVLSQVKVEAVTEQAARAAAGLLKEAGLHGHEYAIDATVAELALRRPGPAAMLTSDIDDMAKLCGGRVRLIAL